MLSAADAASNGINMQDMEASIQASLQAKIEAGASKSEIMAQVGTEELSSSSTSAQSVIASVLSKHNVKAAPAVATPSKAVETQAQAQAS
jgi:hypothetical protein